MKRVLGFACSYRKPLRDKRKPRSRKLVDAPKRRGPVMPTIPVRECLKK